MSISPPGSMKVTLRTIFHYVASSCRLAIFMGAGDVIMQTYNASNKDKKEIDWIRTIKFATIGLCFMGPVLTYWKSIVNKFIIVEQTRTTRIIQQMFCDQVYLAPCLNLGIITMSGLVEHESVTAIEKRIGEFFPCIIKKHYMLWPGVQFFGIPSKLNCLQPFYPYLLCSVQSGLIMTAGDIVAQTWIENKDWDKFQYERTAQFAFIGMVFTGPLLCHWSSLALSIAWYAYLSNLLLPKYENQPQKKRAKLTKCTKKK
ncbi:hypothetical protein DOY81_004581 [Sarcophaga bullata]|nr:hypothetical protein DOY81_004581 [Sarcophaga bullata]